MARERRIEFIRQIAQKPAAFDDLARELEMISRESLSSELLDCGIIPESYEHDSSEEKLWAKYCDVLLSQTFGYLGLQARVIRARGDSADVLGQTEEYSIVGDAKAFRLSRTAKNQKDFKVSALDDWRRGDTFACLVAPLYQYPARSSQIYLQAETKNVTLLSYVHLKFLLDHAPQKSLSALWNVAGNIPPTKDGRTYWEHIDDGVIELTNQSYEQLRAYKRLEIDRMTVIAREGIEYWRSIMAGYHTLSKEEAVARLIRAEKIEQKIRVIEQAVEKAEEAYAG